MSVSNHFTPRHSPEDGRIQFYRGTRLRLTQDFIYDNSNLCIIFNTQIKTQNKPTHKKVHFQDFRLKMLKRVQEPFQASIELKLIPYEQGSPLTF
jgi:hypothetical protein